MIPGIQKVLRLPLDTMNLEMHSPGLDSCFYPVTIFIIAIAEVKINKELLKNVAEQLGGKSPKEIKRICQDTIERHHKVVLCLRRSCTSLS